MRGLLLIALVAVAALGWWQRDAIVARVSPPPAPKPVYRWRDAHGQVHFSTDKPSANAQAVQLKPIQTMPGMSQAQIDATLHPAAAKTNATGADAPAEGAVCDQEDTTEQAKCLNAQAAPRNLAIERMEKAIPSPQAPTH